MTTHETLILTRKEVEEIADMALAMEAVEKAFLLHGKGEAVMPPKVYLPLEAYGGDFRAMPAYVDGIAGVKWVNSHPDNPRRHGLPAVMGVYILSDPETALPLAIMDATALTALRTGASAGVASRWLHAEPPRQLGVIGCGAQAHTLVQAHEAVYGKLPIAAADVDHERAAQFVARMGGRAVEIEEAAGSDIVCIATPSRSPVIQRAWVSAGAHINAMGADAPGKQELDPAILQDAGVFVDDEEQAHESGEVNVPLHSGTLHVDAIRGTLGAVVAQKIPGRQSDSEVTVFDSTGLAIQDAALARRIFEAARQRSLGTSIQFI